MKRFVESMENVKNGEFTIDGKKWTVCVRASGRPDVGTSPKGIWNYMTNGEEKRMIYKADVLKYDTAKAIALFN